MSEHKADVAVMLGSLVPLYEEYQSTLAQAPDEPVRVYYNQQVMLDKIENARKSLAMDATEDEKLERIEGAKYREISGRQAALHAAGFVGTAAKIFEQYVELESIEKEPDEDFRRAVAILQMVPSAQRKGANVVRDGYYYGGALTRIEQDIIHSAMSHVDIS